MVIAMAACAAPQVEIETAPDAPRVFVDGMQVGSGTVRQPLPYYGTIEVRTVPRPAPVEQDDPPPPRAEVVTQFTVPEPFSPWLFPLDFVLETLFEAPFRDEPAHRLAVELPEAPPPAVTGFRPPRLEELRARGRASVVER